MQGFLDQYGSWLGLIGLGLSFVLLGLVVWMALKIRALNRRWVQMMSGSDGNIESLLRESLDRTKAVDGKLGSADERIQALENKIQTAKRFVGVVRYDAFEDVGGSQSFALAVYDERGDGAVLTSMVGRADCRVYAKEIRKGKADRELSREEQAAIEAAVRPRETSTAAAGR